jgi:hypothetical protein
MNELSNSQQFQEEAPVSARKSLAEAMDKANKAYQERASKNEWAEVAQLVGRSLAQFGAAQEGMRTGTNMAGLNFGPGIDYGARTDRAARDYQQELKNISQLEDLSTRERKELQDAARQKYSRESGVLGKALETRLALEREERLAKGAETAEQARIRREDALERKQDSTKAKDETNILFNRAKDVIEDAEKVNERKYTEARKSKEAADKVVNRLTTDASAKNILAWEKTEPDLAGANKKALDTLKAKLAAADKYFNGRTDEEDALDKENAIEEFKRATSGAASSALAEQRRLQETKAQMAAGEITPRQALQSMRNSTSSQKTVVKQLYNPGKNQTKLIYSDGSEEIVSGKR